MCYLLFPPLLAYLVLASIYLYDVGYSYLIYFAFIDRVGVFPKNEKTVKPRIMCSVETANWSANRKLVPLAFRVNTSTSTAQIAGYTGG